MTRDRHEEALVNLRKLRQGTKTENEILQEYETLRIALAEEPEQGSFIELFQGDNRKRTAIVVFTNFFQQATGQAFASQYGTLYVKSLGTINPFNFTVILGFVNLSVTVLCLYLNDKVDGMPCLNLLYTPAPGAHGLPWVEVVLTSNTMLT